MGIIQMMSAFADVNPKEVSTVDWLREVAIPWMESIPVPVMVAAGLLLVGVCLTASCIVPTEDEPTDAFGDVMLESAPGIGGLLMALCGVGVALTFLGVQYMQSLFGS